MFEKVHISKRYLHIGIVTLLIGIILLFVYQLSLRSGDILLTLKQILFNFIAIISPITYAFVIAYVLYRPLHFIERFLIKVLGKFSKRPISPGSVRIIGILFLAAIVIWVISILITSIFPPILNSVNMLLTSLPNFQAEVTKWLTSLIPHFKALPITEAQIQELTTMVTSFLTSVGGSLLSLGTGVVTNLTGFMINLFATIILTFYFLKDKETIFKGIDKLGTVLLSPKTKSRIKYFLKDLHEVFGNFIVGQITDSAIVGVASTILLLIIGHPFALLIGLVAGLTNIIPYIGPIIGAALAFILGLFTSIKIAILGAILLIIYQQIDGNFIQPKILGSSVGLAPVWIFIAILIGGNYFGPLGMILAVPIAALAKVYIDRRFKKVTQ